MILAFRPPRPLTMEPLRRLIEDRTSRGGRLFALAVQGLIVASMISFAFETLPDLSPAVRAFLRRFEIATVALFTVEYLLRVLVARSRKRFVFSFFGVVDLLAILPFYLTTGVDLRALRACRLLRLFQLLKLARYSRAMRRFGRAFVIAREELVLFYSVAALAFFLSGVGIYHFEHEAQPAAFASVFHSLWWSVVTLTTVGYGDVYPVTAGGRLFTAGMLMVGLGLVAVPPGLIAAALTEARREEEEGGSNRR